MISRRLIDYWPSGITVLQASRGQRALSSDVCVKVKQDCVSQYVNESSNRNSIYSNIALMILQLLKISL